jgi:hypothetical protein
MAIKDDMVGVPVTDADTSSDALINAAHDREEAALMEREAVAPPLRRVALAVIPVFMGYSVLLSLQERLRDHLGIHDNKSDAAQVFQTAVSLIFIGDIIFRLMHNVFLTFLRPRNRVLFAYGCIVVSMALIITVFYWGNVTSLTPVFFAYFIGGVGIGTFEANIVSCTTPLGHGTKQWALLGMPLGYNGISIGAFLLFTARPHSVALEMSTFIVVLVFNVIGAFIFKLLIPDVEFEASDDNFFKFIADLKYWREWLPIVYRHLLCMFVNMFCVILMSGVVLYIFKGDDVPLWPGSKAPTMPKDTFQALYNLCSFLGDFSSRRLIYKMKRRIHPAFILIPLLIGLGLGLARVVMLAWVGMFLVMFANGSLYATTTRYVDDSVPRRFNLAVFSVWLFLGDCGSFTASYTTDYIASAVGS